MACRVTLGTALLACVLSPLSALAGQAPASPGTAAPAAGAVTEPEVLLAPVDPDEKFFVWRRQRLQYAVVNGSAPSGIGVTSLRLSVPPALGLRAATGTLPSGQVELAPVAFLLRTPAERREFPPVELKAAPLGELGPGAFALLTYRPRKEVFNATLEYERLLDGTAGSRSVKLVVPVAAHPLAMYLGAIFGSLLTALYFLLPPLRPVKSRDPEPPLPSYPVRDLAVRFVRGALVMGIAVFLLQTTTEIALPISITVHDFSGGVLLGLFGDKVGEVISKRLWG
ncbi:MAG: hypothetical protein ACE147_11210 [Candidatus Methylomirabilales bacterium]